MEKPRNKASEKLLSESFSEIPKQELEKKIEEKQKELGEAKKKYFKSRAKRIAFEIFYTLITAGLLGFCLWAWFPNQFNFHRALALGILYFILFTELKLHLIFKQQ